MTFSSFSAPGEPTIEVDDDGRALLRRCRADDLAGGKLADEDALGGAVGEAAGGLTAEEAAGGGELVTAADGGGAVEEAAGDPGVVVDCASGAGCAVHADASTAISAATAASGRRMAPILADKVLGTPPIGTRTADRFDPSGRWSVLLGAARSCAPTSARPSHPFRVLSCCGETSSTTRFTAGRSSRCTRSFAAAAGSTR